ncbi:MAG: hypothetical protein ACI9IA_001097, partial [Enterobacterales bacterium]
MIMISIMYIKIFTLLFLSFLSIGLSQGAENVIDPLIPAEDKFIKSPIVGKEDKHSQLFRYAFDAKHLLFPVKITSIDGWLVTDFVSTETNHETSIEETGSEMASIEESSTGISVDVKLKALEILLAPGEHQMKVVPDFENIQPQTVFMASPWQEKHITFKLTEGQQIAVAARLLNVDSLEWVI